MNLIYVEEKESIVLHRVKITIDYLLFYFLIQIEFRKKNLLLYENYLITVYV